MEEVEFRYEVEVTGGVTGIQEDRDYSLTTPVDLKYNRHERPTDLDAAGQVYMPKTKSATVMFLVKGSH